MRTLSGGPPAFVCANTPPGRPTKNNTAKNLRIKTAPEGFLSYRNGLAGGTGGGACGVVGNGVAGGGVGRCGGAGAVGLGFVTVVTGANPGVVAPSAGDGVTCPSAGEGVTVGVGVAEIGATDTMGACANPALTPAMPAEDAALVTAAPDPDLVAANAVTPAAAAPSAVTPPTPSRPANAPPPTAAAPATAAVRVTAAAEVTATPETFAPADTAITLLVPAICPALFNTSTA